MSVDTDVPNVPDPSRVFIPVWTSAGNDADEGMVDA